MKMKLRHMFGIGACNSLASSLACCAVLLAGLPAAAEPMNEMGSNRAMSRRTAISPVSRLLVVLAALFLPVACGALELVGLSVTPHTQSPEMRYRRAPEPGLGARVELFLIHRGDVALNIRPEFPVAFDGRSPADLITQGEWAWHDTPPARTNESAALPPGALTVWSFNSRGTNWGAGTLHLLKVGGADTKPIELQLDAPRTWLSAVTFFGQGDSMQPTRAIVHVANESDRPLALRACRLWLPASNADFRVLRPKPWQTNLACFPTAGVIPSGEKGGFTVETGPLPLTYCAVEVETAGSDSQPASLWAYLRIKREIFDLSGGWVASDTRQQQHAARPALSEDAPPDAHQRRHAPGGFRLL